MRDQEVCMSVLKGPFKAASHPDWNSSWQGHQCPATAFLFTGERSNTAVVLLCGVSCGHAKRTAKSKSKLLCQRKFRFPPLQADFCQSSEIMCFFVSFWHSLRCAKFTRLSFSISTCAKCQPSNPTADAIASMALRRSKSGVLQASSHRASKLQISVSMQSADVTAWEMAGLRQPVEGLHVLCRTYTSHWLHPSPCAIHGLKFLFQQPRWWKNPRSMHH